MKIANIVYEDELVNHKEVEYISYHKGDIDHDRFNATLPTLFVGWKFMKNFEIPELQDVNILKHRITENRLYWEFSFDENKSSHVKGVSSFVKNVPDFYYGPRYGYVNLDPVFYQLKDNQDLFDVIPKEIDSFYVFKDRMIYILTGGKSLLQEDVKIYGLDLEMYRFFKFGVDTIKERLLERTNCFINDPEGEFYEKYYKIFPDFSNLKRYLVVLVTN